MSDPLASLFAPAKLTAFLYPPNSRYAGVETKQLTLEDGRTVTYLKRRFVPMPERFQTIKLHVVQQGERLDGIAARELGDPLLFWRLCDANRALRPDELIEDTGTQLRITLPLGIASR